MAVYKTCEISKRLGDLSSSSSSENEDSDYDGVLSSSTSQYSCTSKSAAKTTLQRLPTRRPDPNVSNRNALLARENRRKKKEYLETLEKELDTMKHANKKLHKTLKKHMKVVKKLEHEKEYYKGLVFNRTDVLDLVSALHGKVPPMGAYSPKQSSCSPSDSNRSSSSNFGDQPLTYDLNDDNDSDNAPMYGCETNWDQLFGMSNDQLPDEEGDYFSISRNSDVISGEHNYYQSRPDSGVCLHSVEGTVSLENCLRCEKLSCPLPDELLLG